MQVETFHIAGVFKLTPQRFGDERGFFSETFSEAKFSQATGVKTVFVQDNQSLSRQSGVLRGLHAQRPPVAQAKLVRVTRGRIFDVAVDIRCGSPTFGQWVGVELSAENWSQLFVPKGFLHGFCTLEPDTEVQYKVDAPYSPEHEIGICWNDPQIAIDWPLNGTEPVLSGKDAILPPLSAFASPFMFGAFADG